MMTFDMRLPSFVRSLVSALPSNRMCYRYSLYWK